MKGYTRHSVSKGVLLIIAGLLIAFFPGVINKLFYLLGMGLIIFSIVSVVMSVLAGAPRFAGGVIGVIAGIVITSLPSFVKVGVPMIAGIIFLTSAIERLGSAWRSYKAGMRFIPGVIPGILGLIAGGFLLFHPLGSSTFIRIVLGFILIALGSFNIFTDLKINRPADDGIIDVKDYTVSDDK
ncbi:MAG: DUF308 domain-containing protein [Ruminococcus sp.]|nr:DUF308 domain-containing protein [Ruminococcus sp.]